VVVKNSTFSALPSAQNGNENRIFKKNHEIKKEEERKVQKLI
jgi:hypothetical protein